MGITRRLGGSVLSRVQPPEGPSSQLVHQALRHAIDGVGPLHGAREAASRALDSADGDVDEAIDRLVRVHVGLSGAEGFLTNVGGIATAAWAVPANIGGLALVQIRLVAAIAHLRGYDLEDARVRNAVLATLLGRSTVRALVKVGKLPGTPREIAALPPEAAAPEPVPPGRAGSRSTRSRLDRMVGAQVAATLLGEVGGKRVAAFAGRRIPVVGGVIGAGSDAWNTRGTGAFARAEFVTRTSAPTAPAARASGSSAEH